jgi:uncharacterized protein (DUF1684 family)
MGKSISLGLILLLFAGCQGNLEERAQKQTDSIYISAVTHERQQKDDAFAMSANSPFRDVKEEFTGLQYYPVSPEWKVNCEWDKNRSGDTLLIPDSKGRMRTYQLAGTFKFRLQNRDCEIPAYFEDSAKTLFFVMFRDSSNTTETYQGGRYIEFQHAGGNEIVLDFNRAFNPYCHYNHNYACPVVPPSHFIPLFIRAGERRYAGM